MIICTLFIITSATFLPMSSTPSTIHLLHYLSSPLKRGLTHENQWLIPIINSTQPLKIGHGSNKRVPGETYMQKRGENHEHMPPAFNIMLSCFQQVYEVNIVISPILCSRSSCLWNEIKLSNLQCGWSGFCIFYYPPSQMSYRALDEVMNIKVVGELVLSYSWSAHIKGCRNLLCV